VMIPDKVTGQPRQIDVLIEFEAYEHTLRLVVDAKFHSEKLDVRDVEGVFRINKLIHSGDTHGSDWTTEIEAIPTGQQRIVA